MIAKALQDMYTLSEVLQFHETSFVHLKDKAGEALQHFSEILVLCPWFLVTRGSSLCVYNSPPGCYVPLLDETDDGGTSQAVLLGGWKVWFCLSSLRNVLNFVLTWVGLFQSPCALFSSFTNAASFKEERNSSQSY